MFVVPAGTPQFYEPRRVPHGTVHRTSYESRTLGAEMSISVYTPPGYETSTARYPVLYLLRPGGRSGVTYWTRFGLLDVILDNLIADQKVRPMVVVMPSGYPQPSDRDDFAEQSEYVENNERFAEDLFNDLIPFIERTYRAVTDADGRAIAGASMGGLQALSIGLANPDRFHWIGGFSGLGALSRNPDWETRFAKPFKEPQAVNRSVRVLWFAAGDQETGVRARNAEFSRMLDQHGIRHTFRAVTGWNHQPGLWRQNLHDFVQLLFRE